MDHSYKLGSCAIVCGVLHTVGHTSKISRRAKGSLYDLHQSINYQGKESSPYWESGYASSEIVAKLTRLHQMGVLVLFPLVFRLRQENYEYH